MNDADVQRQATTRYQDDRRKGKVPVNLWSLLSRSPKWQQLNNPEVGLSKKRSSAEVEADDAIDLSEQRPPFNLDDSDDEDPVPRPIGRKKAKPIALGFARSGSFPLAVICVGK
ncbi:unnamed protein product [Cuscuta campestris]|uniref:No apical meristem-associated C-terminal domain-containing protein n=1 Tax=Cuscuta campestris TaxID=132261 RepID=A0A484KW57_9ASTE|nr:unnamed protein product [Cuscuta campestris]